MRIVFYVAPGKYAEEALLKCVRRACKYHGDSFETALNSGGVMDGEHLAVMVGMKSFDLRLRCLAAGLRVVTFDKGYDRKDDWWRFSVDTHQPTRYLDEMARPGDRRDENGWVPALWQTRTNHLIIASGGLKYHFVHGLAHPTTWVAEIAAAVRAAGYRDEIKYRPKPSMPNVEPVADTTLSRDKYIMNELVGCHALITYGSNACFEAMIAGVPSIVLGDAVGRGCASRSVNEVMDPLRVDEETRMQWLANLAYCQVRLREMTEFWPEIKRQVEVLPRANER